MSTDPRSIMVQDLAECISEDLSADASYLVILCMTKLGLGPNAKKQRELRAIGVEVLLEHGRCCCGRLLPPPGGRCEGCSTLNLGRPST